MSRVLIAGGSGFLGSWVAEALLARGKAVRIFDRALAPATLDAERRRGAGAMTVTRKEPS